MEHTLGGIEWFWGKARPADKEEGEEKAVMHPLMAHVLDVAAVAVLLAEEKSSLLEPSQLGFLVALHDIGKLSPHFQAKVPECWPGTILGPLSPSQDIPGAVMAGGRVMITSCRHDEVSKAILNSLCHGPTLAGFFVENAQGKSWKITEKQKVLSGIAGHHGKPVSDDKVIVEKNILAHAEIFISQLWAVFQPSPLPLPLKKEFRQMQWQLAAITVLADWIGSRQEWFSYVTPQDVITPKTYYQNHALPQARIAIQKAGLAPCDIAPFHGVKGLFSHISHLSPVQKVLETVELPKSPTLIIVEDMTGSGKTEAALTATHRLMAMGRGEGVFVALPTMATANAMYDRLAGAYRRLFSSSAQPSIALAHGRAKLDDRFIAAIEPEKRDNLPVYDEGDEDSVGTAEALCAEWLGSENRRALLAQVGVGTIDQALLAVLPVRFATIRQGGLARKILIVDECHAFDPYMGEEMAALLHFHAAMGGSAILLSATLTQKTRQDLVKAFCRGLGLDGGGVVSSHAYPLVTIASSSGIEEVPCTPRAGLSRTIAVQRMDSPESAEEKLGTLAKTGAAIGWIRNTVDDVISTARRFNEQGVKVLVFHARFAMKDRLAIERTILAHFGKESTGEERAGVLIASQVIEQSLDLDFDVLCTDLAPMDLIIQRAGRLRRHDRRNRPIDREELFVVSPPPVADPDKNWVRKVLPGTAAVYADTAMLWRTARALFHHHRLTVPEDIRELIEQVGDSQSEGAIPNGLKEESFRAEGRAKAKQHVGRSNVLTFESGYELDTASWGHEIRTPTRLQDEEYVTLRLAFVQEGRVMPWAVREETSFHGHHKQDWWQAWALSEVSIRQRWLAKTLPPPGMERAVEEARQSWTRWERKAEGKILLLVLLQDSAGWYGFGQDSKGRDVRIGYDPLLFGLEFSSVN
ncbi:CRISPR-associated helicase Cas3' [Entomobacter blattae]|uniref:CRISPR-associated endonuclease/helicase Cas3 n=1 Tax=Entomobacter blattae TaxID=2762277 RepID=A0A7H1NU65_9PROT|nr:CRISPR-associated helicase Cas3' [Entomobacter blattae]QNT79325.1 CRISPR-associated endonuclease/helicase Cas3 [Entomobacter blattae]